MWCYCKLIVTLSCRPPAPVIIRYRTARSSARFCAAEGGWGRVRAGGGSGRAAADSCLRARLPSAVPWMCRARAAHRLPAAASHVPVATRSPARARALYRVTLPSMDCQRWPASDTPTPNLVSTTRPCLALPSQPVGLGRTCASHVDGMTMTVPPKSPNFSPIDLRGIDTFIY